MKTILEALQTRNSKTEFGYGLSTAEPYVRRVVEAMGAGGCREQFAVADADEAVKHASGVLTYAVPEMEVTEKATSSNGFQQLLPDGVEAPANTLMVIRHVLTSTKEDRDNDVLETKGASLDPKAPLLWQHMHTLPIGSVLGTVSHTDTELKVASALVDLNDLTSDAAKLVEANVLRFSHGFRALEFEERKENNERGGFPGFRVTKFEIMEASLVSVPSNTDAAIEAFSKAKLESKYFKTMKDTVLKSNTTGWVRGVTLPTDEKYDTQMLLKLGGAEVVVSATKNPPSAADSDTPSRNETPESAAVLDEQGKEIEVEREADLAELESKGGRTISAANLKTLKDVKDDIDELSGMEIPRAGKALCSRCSSQLQKVIDSASREDKPDNDKPNNKPENKPEDKPDKWAEVTFETAASFILCHATSAQQRSLANSLQAIFSVDELDEKAAAYRSFVG